MDEARTTGTSIADPAAVTTSPDAKAPISGRSAALTDEIGALKVTLEALEPLNAQQRAFVIRAAVIRYGLDSAAPSTPAAQNQTAASAPTGIPSTFTGQAGEIRRFMGQKRPENQMERAACLAYYLIHAKQVVAFETDELTKANTEAGGPRMNTSDVVQKTIARSGYLSHAAGGKFQLSPRGESVVEALPERDSVTKALKEHPFGRRKTKRTSKPKSKP